VIAAKPLTNPILCRYLKDRKIPLENEHFKGSSSPKDVTQITNSEAKDIAVFEGFFSFLSYQIFHLNNPHLTNFLVLNSLSFFEKSRQLMENKEKIHLYLDRDEAGMKHTNEALKWDKRYIDQSHLYKNYKDLNDCLVHQNQKINHRQQLRRRI